MSIQWFYQGNPNNYKLQIVLQKYRQGKLLFVLSVLDQPVFLIYGISTACLE